MKTIHILMVFLLAGGLGATNAHAEARTWELDKDHTFFYFTVDHIYSKVRGQFLDYSGMVRFDPENLADSRFDFTIAVKSVDTHNSKRDRHLRSDDFFDADTFPKMTFVSTGITRTGADTFDVAGSFSVKGVAHDLVLPLTFAGITDNPMKEGQQVAGFNGSLTIDRLQYKVGSGKYYEMGVVGKDVDILVSMELLSDK